MLNEGIKLQFSKRRDNDGFYLSDIMLYSEASDPVLHQRSETCPGETFDEQSSQSAVNCPPPEG